MFTEHAISGVASAESEAYLLATVPAKPTVAPTEGSNTNANQIEVSIQEVTDTNGASILSYHVQVDDGDGGDFITASGLDSHDLSTKRIIASGIRTGALYRARYRARNAKGFSNYSPIGYIEASQEPDKPSSPKVTTSGTNVVISWTLPFNQGNAITLSEIYVKNKAGDMLLHTTAEENTSITIPMTHMLTIYNLLQGDDIVATVRVQNDNGWSLESAQSTNNAKVQVQPHKPSTPPQNTNTARQAISISVSELTGTATGGSEITSYQVEYYKDESIKSELSSDASTRVYTVTGLTIGETYFVRYRARNVHGWGEYSELSSILVAEKPQKIPHAAATVLNGSTVQITWGKPLSEGTPITGYLVEFKDVDGAFVTLPV